MKKIIGYSGHVPCRNDNVGVTAGESLRLSQLHFEMQTTKTTSFANRFANKRGSMNYESSEPLENKT